MVWMVMLMCFAAVEQESNLQYVLQAGDTPVLQVPVCMDLAGVDFTHDGQIPVLYRLEDDTRIPIACQVENGHSARLWFVPDRIIAPQETISLEIAFEPDTAPMHRMSSTRDDQAVTLYCQETPIVRYMHALHEVPEGVSPLYRRSGFIHPVWSPASKVITQIQPPSHLHQYGLMNPWTKTKVQGQEVDFWNLDKGQGTVRFAGMLSHVSGPVYAGFKVRHEHVVLKGRGSNLVAMNEMWDVRAFASNLEDEPIWIVDFTTTLHNALDSSIELCAYRYGGGIHLRASEHWKGDDCLVLTSEGKTRNNADATRARWCDIKGHSEPDIWSGVVFLSHPANREHPEPMRVWPSGELLFGFCPARLKSWILEPEQEYVLRYRLLIYDGALDPDLMDKAWSNFVDPPVITKF